MKALTLSVALILAMLIGCVAAQVIIPPVRAGSSPQRWEYLCGNIVFEGMSGFKKIAADAGREGWELVGVFGGSGDAYCFKRPLP